MGAARSDPASADVATIGGWWSPTCAAHAQRVGGAQAEAGEYIQGRAAGPLATAR